MYRYATEHHPEFVEKLKQLGARYIRTLPAEDDPNSPIGRSYKSAYNVASEEELEAKLVGMNGTTLEWNDDGSVRVMTQAVPAIRLVADHSQNYVFQYTFANSIIAAHLGWQDVRNDRHDALRFGNMEKMDESVLDSIAGFMERERILYTWKKGDILAINNMREFTTLHLCAILFSPVSLSLYVYLYKQLSCIVAIHLSENDVYLRQFGVLQPSLMSL